MKYAFRKNLIPLRVAVCFQLRWRLQSNSDAKDDVKVRVLGMHFEQRRLFLLDLFFIQTKKAANGLVVKAVNSGAMWPGFKSRRERELFRRFGGLMRAGGM